MRPAKANKAVELSRVTLPTKDTTKNGKDAKMGE